MVQVSKNVDFGKTIERSISAYNATVPKKHSLNFEDNWKRKGKKKQSATLRRLIETGFILPLRTEPTVRQINDLEKGRGILLLEEKGIFDSRIPEKLGAGWNRIRKKATSLSITRGIDTQEEADQVKNRPRILINNAYGHANPNIDYLGYEFQGLIRSTESFNKIRLADLVDAFTLYRESNKDPDRIVITPKANKSNLEETGARFDVRIKSLSDNVYDFTLGNVPVYRQQGKHNADRGLWRSIVVNAKNRCLKSVYDAFHYPQSKLRSGQIAERTKRDGQYLEDTLRFRNLEGERKAETQILCDHVLATLIKIKQMTIENKRVKGKYVLNAEKFYFSYDDLPLVPLSQRVIGENGFDDKLRRVGYVVKGKNGQEIRTRNYSQREIILNRAFVQFGPEWFNSTHGWQYDFTLRGDGEFMIFTRPENIRKSYSFPTKKE